MVYRITGLFDRMGNASPKAHSANPGTAKLTENDKFLILELAINKPGIYLREIQEQLHSETGTEVDMSTQYAISYMLLDSPDRNLYLQLNNGVNSYGLSTCTAVSNPCSCSH